MSLELELIDGQILLLVKAQPGSKRNEIRGIQNGRLKICVTQVAEKGKANEAIKKLLTKTLGISKSDIELIRGESSALKTFTIRNLSIQELRQKANL